MIPWQLIEKSIQEATDSSFVAQKITALSGGCINNAYKIETGKQRYFVKINAAHLADMFDAEAQGLIELAKPQALKVPIPICNGTAQNFAFLVMEYLDFGNETSKSMEVLGRGLAMLHLTTADYFGWQRDNTIGSTPQINTPRNDWCTFWREHRLGFQLQLAACNDSIFRRREEALNKVLMQFFANHQPRPSLLHGDLWRGNVAVTHNGEPVIFDPAVYYGDRETDLAMTELFGGFSESFYAAYREVWQLPDEYQMRKQLYNLYHVLNHYNLFGGSYAQQALRIIDNLLKTI